MCACFYLGGMCVHIHFGVHTPIRTQAEARGRHWVTCSITLHFISLRCVSLLTQFLMLCLDWNSGNPRDLPDHTPCTPGQRLKAYLAAMLSCLTWKLGTEFGSSCLCNKHFITEPSPQPSCEDIVCLCKFPEVEWPCQLTLGSFLCTCINSYLLQW